MKWMCEHWIVIFSAAFGEPDHRGFVPYKERAVGEFILDCLTLPFGVYFCIYGLVASLRS